MTRCFLLLPLLLLGCPKSGSEEVSSGEASVLECVAKADLAWVSRGDSFEAATEAIEACYQIDPRHPEVLWRLVRLQIAEGLAADDPRAGQYAFAEGRSLGLQCLDHDVTFAQIRGELGLARALGRVESGSADCLIWTLMAWTRWIEAHGGDAAALDIPVVDALARRARKFAPQNEVWRVSWAEGILAAVRPAALNRDLEKARRLLETAVEARPANVLARFDLVNLVAVPLDDPELIRSQIKAVKGKSWDEPEQNRAHQRLLRMNPG